jgi:hypothetical protein
VVRVPGPTVEQLSLGGICLNQETGSNYFEAPVSNDGNVLTKAEGALTLTTKDGREVFTREATLGSVVPRDKTLVRLDAPFNPGPGNYVAKLRLRQTNGQEIQSESPVTIRDKKVNGCSASALGERQKPSQPVWLSPPGGAVPWLLLVLLASVIFALLAGREYLISRGLRRRDEGGS